MSNSTETVVHNQEKNRFEVINGSQVSKLLYQMKGEDQIELVHTEVPEDLAGQGIGSDLVTTALQYARDHKLQAIPSCPFVASYVQRHPEWNDVVVEL
ncbi:GNAT family N-acetyltransferase [Lewinella sp. JB7]|uniref:GNAT family N-acetyltransferase n=1 Tax=Lewinella sp. JB7 TaxID=2962887 RepID=UPI0020C9D5BE|nr:GNAT family N-acetyltransferase [Lewinella sp. JB7]MCP9237051.1 N-acetyltransferase [Lewinella sp. JB7]